MFLLLLATATVAHAYTTFTPNCTTPDHPFNFVNTPDGRSTLDIFWSSFFTLIACTWSILHLNVPPQRDRQDEGWRGTLKWGIYGVWRKLKWMLLTMLAPELLMTFAAGHLAHGIGIAEKFRRFAEQDGVEWTLTHSLFADMGGFLVRGIAPTAVTPAPHAPGSKDSKSGHIAADIESAQKVPLAQSKESPAAEVPITSADGVEFRGMYGPYYLTTCELLMLREKGHLQNLPHITAEEINARSKGDSFSKMIAVVQIFWSTFQIIVRAVRGLPVSQLELSVVAFALCAIAIYILEWYRPKDIDLAFTVLQYQGPIPVSVYNDLGVYEGASDRIRLFGEIIPVPEAFLPDDSIYGQPISNDTCWLPNDEDSNRPEKWATNLALLVGSALFGAIHVAAWNFKFPTTIEIILWRISSILCTTLPALDYIATTAVKALVRRGGHEFERTDSWRLHSGSVLLDTVDLLRTGFIFISCIAYIVARLFMLVEVFRTLAFLPVGAYTSTWASDIPHVT